MLSTVLSALLVSSSSWNFTTTLQNRDHDCPNLNLIEKDIYDLREVVPPKVT